jgi:glucose/arabinose dehydrogenase
MLKFQLTIVLLLSIRYGWSQPEIGLDPFAIGLLNPVDIKTAGDTRLFIVERDGIIVIADSSGQLYSRPFLDIHDRVKTTGNEQGLLGIVFHPEYQGNGYFYVNYTGAGDSTHISRFSVSSSDPDSAMAESEFRLLTIFQPYQNHNGGDLQFGPDGYLYIGLGDGGSAGDPGNRAQDLSQLLGKMLRIDVNTGNPYSIPPDNPFIMQPQAREEIWALGLRNPWRFSFDRGTKNLWIADVGQGSFEEINFQPESSAGGENYGWRCYEGFAPYNTTGCLPAQDYIEPVYAYQHDLSPCWSITGGYVYRGLKYPEFQNRYFFADYCKDSLWALSNNSGTWQVSLRAFFPGNNFSTFGENEKGELFIAGYETGTIYRIFDRGSSGISPDREKQIVTVSPNPFSGWLRITVSSGYSLKATIRIVDMYGKIVYITHSSETETLLNTEFLNPGIYSLCVEFTEKPERTKNFKVIKR